MAAQAIKMAQVRLPRAAVTLLCTDRIVDCRINGVLRLSGRACLKRQVATGYPRYINKSCGRAESGKHINPQFLACIGCDHFLLDSDYTTARRLVLASNKMSPMQGGGREAHP